jgi:hypothetical protein
MCYRLLGQAKQRSGKDMKAEELSEAESLFRKSLAIYTEIFGQYNPSHPTIASGHYFLGKCCLYQNNQTEANDMIKSSYQMRMETLGTDHPDTVLAQTLLATL